MGRAVLSRAASVGVQSSGLGAVHRLLGQRKGMEPPSASACRILTNISSTSKERLMSMDEFKGRFGSHATKQLVGKGGKAPPLTQAS